MLGASVLRNIVASLLFVLAVPTWAQAQDSGPNKEDKEQARELFSKGVEASENGNSETAVAFFLKSFEHFPAPNTAVNIAGIYLELQKYEEVIEWANRAKSLPDIQPSAVDIADSYIAQAKPYVESTEPEQGDASQPDATEPVVQPEPEPEPDPVAASLTAEEPLEESSDDGAITEQWWFWTGVGVLVVGATVGVIAVASGGEEDPVGGNLMPGVVTWN